MNDNLFASAVRSLHGDLVGNLHAVWRRAAERAAHGEPIEPLLTRQRRSRALCVAPAVAALLAFAAMTVGGALDDANAAPAPAQITISGAEAPFAQRHADAVQALRAQRYADAYGRFAQLADEGHAPSAAVAWLMVCHGASLFGSQWSATPGQLQRWGAMAMQDLRERGVQLADHDRGE